MTASADQILDRRRLRRKLGFWRITALLLTLAVGLAVFFAYVSFAFAQRLRVWGAML